LLINGNLDKIKRELILRKWLNDMDNEQEKNILAQIARLPGITPQQLQALNTYQQLSANKRREDELNSNFAKNKSYAKEGVYETELPADKEEAFSAWVEQNKVPYDSKMSVQDYDMRGFWQALQNKDPRAVSAIDPNDQKIHYPDYWKTPYHETFSNESQWATDKAPKWNDKDQLVDLSGKVVFDDRAQNKASK